jgi:Ethanolamine utilization protein EutJ (predicted chaperonin)
MVTLTSSAEQLLLVLHADCRALIGALKVQRWDATKWAVTVNFALATVSIVLGDAKWVALVMAIAVAVFGLYLVWHYNERVTLVRKNLKKLNDYLRENIFDFNAEVGLSFGVEKSRDYDMQELMVFYAAIILSALPSWVMMVAK